MTETDKQAQARAEKLLDEAVAQVPESERRALKDETLKLLLRYGRLQRLLEAPLNRARPDRRAITNEGEHPWTEL